MKYCRVMEFTSGRPPEPATDHRLLTSTPMVHFPGWTNATMAGPMLSFPVPRTLSEAVGSRKVGPAPQMIFPALAGERKNEGLMSVRPKVPCCGCAMFG